jgi:hypothetical protein
MAIEYAISVSPSFESFAEENNITLDTMALIQASLGSDMSTLLEELRVSYGEENKEKFEFLSSIIT